MNSSLNKPNKKARRILSISTGNLIQAACVVVGCILLWFCTQPNGVPVRIISMITGSLLIYFSSHSSAHYIVGRLGGIKFSHYSVGGSSHASMYPPGIRQIFERLPFLAVHADPQSLRSASRLARAFMFGSGIICTAVVCTLGALFVFRADVPGSSVLLIFNVIWQISSLIAEMRQHGDLGKAAKAFKSL